MPYPMASIQAATGMLGGEAEVAQYVTIPQYQTISSDLIDGFEDHTSWTKTYATGAAPADDAVNFVQGEHSVRLANVGVQSWMDKALSFTLASTDHIGLDIYVHSGTAGNRRYAILLSNTPGGFTKYMYCTLRFRIATVSKRPRLASC